MADLDKLVTAWDAVNAGEAQGAAGEQDPALPKITKPHAAAQAAETDYLDRHPEMAGTWEQIKAKRYPWAAGIPGTRRAAVQSSLEAERADTSQRNLERAALATGGIGGNILRAETFGFYDPRDQYEQRTLAQARAHAGGGLEGLATDVALGAGSLAGTLAAPLPGVGKLTELGLGAAARFAPAAGEALGSLGGSALGRLGLGTAKTAADFAGVAAISRPPEGRTRGEEVLGSIPSSLAFGLSGPLAGSLAGKALAGRAFSPLAEKAAGLAGAALGGGVAGTALAATEGKDLGESLRAGVETAATVGLVHGLAPKGAGERAYESGVGVLHGRVKEARAAKDRADASGLRPDQVRTQRELSRAQQDLINFRAQKDLRVATGQNPQIEQIAADAKARSGRVSEAHAQLEQTIQELQALDVREQGIRAVQQQMPGHDLTPDLDAVRSERSALQTKADLLRVQETEHALTGAEAKLPDGTTVLIKSLEQARTRSGASIPAAVVIQPDGTARKVRLDTLQRVTPAESKAAADQARGIASLKALRESDPGQFQAVINPPADAPEATRLAAHEARKALGMPPMLASGTEERDAARRASLLAAVPERRAERESAAWAASPEGRNIVFNAAFPQTYPETAQELQRAHDMRKVLGGPAFPIRMGEGKGEGKALMREGDFGQLKQDLQAQNRADFEKLPFEMQVALLAGHEAVRHIGDIRRPGGTIPVFGTVKERAVADKMARRLYGEDPRAWPGWVQRVTGVRNPQLGEPAAQLEPEFQGKRGGPQQAPPASPQFTETSQQTEPGVVEPRKGEQLEFGKGVFVPGYGPGGTLQFTYREGMGGLPPEQAKFATELPERAQTAEPEPPAAAPTAGPAPRVSSRGLAGAIRKAEAAGRLTEAQATNLLRQVEAGRRKPADIQDELNRITGGAPKAAPSEEETVKRVQAALKARNKREAAAKSAAAAQTQAETEQAVADRLGQARERAPAESELGSVAPKKGAATGPTAAPLAPHELGSTTGIAVAGERETLPAQFAIVEHDTLQPSHTIKANGTVIPNKQLPADFNTRNYYDPAERTKVFRGASEMPEKHGLLLGTSPDPNSGPPIVTREGRVVLGGNGRVMMRGLAAETGRDSEYRAALVRDAAQYGLDPKAVAAMKAPMLVRVVDADPLSDRGRALVAKLNLDLKESQGPGATAAAIGRTIPDSLITDIDFGADATTSEILSGRTASSKALLEAVFKMLPDSEKSRYFVDASTPTDAGKDLLQNLVLSKALPPEVVAKAPQWLKEQLTKALPQMIQLRGGDVQKSRNPLPQIQEALQFYASELGGGSVKLSDWEAQPMLMGEKATLSPGARAFVEWIEGQSKAKTSMRSSLGNYLEALRGSDKGALFGGSTRTAHEMLRESFSGINLPDEARIGPERASERGAVTWGGSRNDRRALIRAHGGDAQAAETAWRYRNLQAERPLLAREFRAETLDSALARLREGGLREDQVELVRRLEGGEDLQHLHKELAPHLSFPQFLEKARGASIQALLAADQVFGKNGLSAPESLSYMSQLTRAWGDPRTLVGGGKSLHELNTMARLQRLGNERDPETGRKLGRGNINVSTGGGMNLRRAFADPWSNMPAEVANTVFQAERNLNVKIRAYENSRNGVFKLIDRHAKATGDSGLEGLDPTVFGMVPQKLSNFEVALADAGDGLTRINRGAHATPEQVAQFVSDKAAEFEQLSPGADRDFRAAVTVMRNMFEGVRREHETAYGYEISPNIPEGMYLSHVFSGDDGPRTYGRLPRVLQDAVGSRGYSRFEKTRTGAEGWVPDPKTVMRDYFPAMLRKMATDQLINDKSPLVRQVYGERTTLGADIGKSLEAGLTDGAINNSSSGGAIVRSLNLIAKKATRESLKHYEYVSIPGQSLAKMRDAQGQPIQAAGVARNGSYHFLRSGKPVGVGDRSIFLQPVSGSTTPVEIPLTRENLSRMHVHRGGVLGLATEFHQTGRLEAAEQWLDSLKLGNEPSPQRGAIGKIAGALSTLSREVGYTATLGALQVKPMENNIAGGLFMATAHLGAEPVASALPRAAAYAAGRGSEATKSLLRRMGVIEEQGAVIGGTIKSTSIPAEALKRAQKAGFAGFTFGEKFNRATAGIAGYERFHDYADNLVSTLYGTHGIPRDELLTLSRGKVFRADGSELPGGDRLAYVMDGSKGERPRQLNMEGIRHELDEVALMHGRAAVGKTQFLYSTWFTPPAMQTWWGKPMFMLNQYPIRAAMNFWDATAGERNPQRVARWLAVGIAASTAAHYLNRDMSSALGPRVGDLLGDDQTKDAQDDSIAGGIKRWFMDLNVPFPVPFSSGHGLADQFSPPFVEQAKLVGELGYSALGFDPANPLPDSWTAADAWHRFGLAWTEAGNREKSAVLPGQLTRAARFLRSPSDEQGRRQVSYGNKPGYVTHMTPGEFALQELVPGSSKDTYDPYNRAAAREGREQDRDSVARAYKMNAVRMADPAVSEPDKEFIQRQQQQMLTDNPHLKTVDVGELEKFKRSAHVSGEVRALMAASLSERARGWFDWRAAEKPGPAEQRESMAILFGDTPKSFAARFKELSAEDPSLALKLRAEWNRVQQLKEVPDR